MERFDAAEALRYLEQYEITHSQWVPTMFSRILKLPEEQRTGYDWGSHQVAVHAAAPCPVEVKKQMFDLWGPIIYEYYAGTEVNGFVFCTPDDWLARPGTVGKSILGTIHICDEMGNELPSGEAGTIYFEREEMPFEYHNDPEKTKGAQHPEHPFWSTLGDVGYLDDDGYLFLTDRKAFMIIAGGVNIYPQEIEDCLIMHPKVADVAVFGVPNEDLGRGGQGGGPAGGRASSPATSWPRSCWPTRRSTSPATRCPGRSTSATSCPAYRRASSTSASCATSTGATPRQQDRLGPRRRRHPRQNP